MSKSTLHFENPKAVSVGFSCSRIEVEGIQNTPPHFSVPGTLHQLVGEAGRHPVLELAHVDLAEAHHLRSNTLPGELSALASALYAKDTMGYAEARGRVPSKFGPRSFTRSSRNQPEEVDQYSFFLPAPNFELDLFKYSKKTSITWFMKFFVYVQNSSPE